MQICALQVDSGQFGAGKIGGAQIGLAPGLSTGFNPNPMLIQHLREFQQRNYTALLLSRRRNLPVFQFRSHAAFFCALVCVLVLTLFRARRPHHSFCISLHAFAPFT